MSSVVMQFRDDGIAVTHAAEMKVEVVEPVRLLVNRERYVSGEDVCRSLGVFESDRRFRVRTVLLVILLPCISRSGSFTESIEKLVEVHAVFKVAGYGNSLGE